MSAEPASDPFDLTRFVAAQDSGDTYLHALEELRRGRKVTHWMWFVFPQIVGLGRSATARRFSLSGLEEATRYAAHPILGPRLLQCCSLTTHQRGRAAEDIFGNVDAVKLRSSVTLFQRAVPEQPLFGEVIDLFFDGQPDPATDEQLALLHRSP